MAVSFSPEVDAALQAGDLAFVDLVRFEFPVIGSVGYHMGGRPFTYQGTVFKPNRFLALGYDTSGLGVTVTTTTLTFSNVPVDDVDDAIGKLETLQYDNAPVTITRVIGVPGGLDPIGVLWSKFYEISEVRYPESPTDEKGEKTLTIEIDLEPPGRSARGITGVKRSVAEQQFDNDASDTGLREAATTARIPIEWGTQQG